MPRTVVGLSIGSSVESIDAAVVRATGIGLAIVPHLERTARVPIPAAVREDVSAASRTVADAAAQAVRSVVVQSGCSARDVFAIGLLEPAHAAGDATAWPEVADRIA